jgi:hypothetical protein
MDAICAGNEFALGYHVQKQSFYGYSSTGNKRVQGGFANSWADNTDATFKGRLTVTAQDSGGSREVLRAEANGTAGLLGFFGHAAALQQANASQAAINAISDSNAKAVCQALYNLLVAYGLAPATA